LKIKERIIQFISAGSGLLDMESLKKLLPGHHTYFQEQEFTNKSGTIWQYSTGLST